MSDTYKFYFGKSFKAADNDVKSQTSVPGNRRDVPFVLKGWHKENKWGYQ